MKIVRLTNGRKSAVRSILEALPLWFGIPEARENYIVEAEALDLFFCENNGDVIGFLSLKVHNSWNAEIHCMGVLPQLHGCGAGTLLVDAASTQARLLNSRLLSVKTLSPASNDQNYAQTRDFYKSCGFEPFEEFPDLWGEENPCLLMVKSID